MSLQQSANIIVLLAYYLQHSITVICKILPLAQCWWHQHSDNSTVLLAYCFQHSANSTMSLATLSVYSQNISTARKKQHRYICSICTFFHLCVGVRSPPMGEVMPKVRESSLAEIQRAPFLHGRWVSAVGGSGFLQRASAAGVGVHVTTLGGVARVVGGLQN